MGNGQNQQRTCTYEFTNGGTCSEPAYVKSAHCLRHHPLPQDPDSSEYEELVRQKQREVHEKIERGETNFQGVVLASFEPERLNTNELDLRDAEVQVKVDLSEARIHGDLIFEGATVEGDLVLKYAAVKGTVSLKKATVRGSLDFRWFEDEAEPPLKGQADQDQGHPSRASATLIDRMKNSFCWVVSLLGRLCSSKRESASVERGQAGLDGVRRFAASVKTAMRSNEAHQEQQQWLRESAELNYMAGIDLSGADVGKVQCNKRSLEFVNCTNSHIQKNALFNGAKVQSSVNFSDADVLGPVCFYDAVVGGVLRFDKAHVKYGVKCKGARLQGDVSFKKAMVEAELSFRSCVFGSEESEAAEGIKQMLAHVGTQPDSGTLSSVGSVNLNGSEIDGMVDFGDAVLHSRTYIETANAKRGFDFSGTDFATLEDEENAWRKAKIAAEKLGRRKEADWCFVRQMRASRKQGNWRKRIVELVVDCTCKYGTSWEHILLVWFSVVLAFALIFFVCGGVDDAPGFFQNLYFSLVTATTVGYGDYQPNPGWPQLAAGLEAALGSFCWAAFVVVFARKYMR